MVYLASYSMKNIIFETSERPRTASVKEVCEDNKGMYGDQKRVNLESRPERKSCNWRKRR